MERGHCDMCRRPVWFAHHEPTWRLVCLDPTPSVSGKYAVSRSHDGTIVVRSVYNVEQVETAPAALFSEHGCTASAVLTID